MTLKGIDADSQLLAFWSFLWGKKRILLIYAFCFGILGSGIATSTSTRFTADAVILPPTESQLADFILAKIAISRATSPEIYDLLEYSEIFRAFKIDLASRAHQASFLRSDRNPLARDFEPMYLAESKDGYSSRTKGGDYAAFSTRWLVEEVPNELFWKLGIDRSSELSIEVEGDRTSHRPDIILRVTWRDANQAASLANNLLKYIDSVTATRVKTLLVTGIGVRIDNLKDMIAYQRKLAVDLQHDNIQRLTEAISIARQLGIKSPSRSFGDFNIVNIVPPPSYYTDPGSALKKYEPGRTPQYLPLYYPGAIARSNESDDIEFNGPPIYARGWHALEEELRILKNRKDLDPFIPQLTKLKNELAWLESINPEEVVLATSNVISAAVSPTQPSSTPVWVIISASSILGILFGALISLIRNATRLSHSAD